MQLDHSLFHESRILGCGFRSVHAQERETKTLQNMGSKDANRERVKKMPAQALASSLLSLVRGFGIGTPNWPPMIRGDDVMVL